MDDALEDLPAVEHGGEMEATAWAWAYYQLIMGAEDDSLCTLWDLMPLPAMV